MFGKDEDVAKRRIVPKNRIFLLKKKNCYFIDEKERSEISVLQNYRLFVLIQNTRQRETILFRYFGLSKKTDYLLLQLLCPELVCCILDYQP